MKERVDLGMQNAELPEQDGTVESLRCLDKQVEVYDVRLLIQTRGRIGAKGDLCTRPEDAMPNGRLDICGRAGELITRSPR